MAETLVKTPTCSKCGEDARPQALFCHSCGGKIIDLPEDEDGNVSSAWFKGEIVESASQESEEAVSQDSSDSGAAVERKKADFDADSEREDEEEAIEKPAETLPEPETGKTVEDSLPTAVKIKRKEDHREPDSEEDDSTGKKKLTPASELRRRPKPVRTKRVEVVWEENYGSPNWMFLLFGLLLAAVGVTIFVLAFYLK